LKELQQLENYIKLSDLTQRIQKNLEDSFGSHAFWVIADVTNHTFKSSNNYHYFELVEKDAHSSRILAKIAGRAWGMGAMRVANFELLTGQQFSNNVHVLIQVVVQYSPAFGLQLNLIDIDASFTLGEFEKQRLATLELLTSRNPNFIQKLGDAFITTNKKQLLKPVLQTLAVLSSDTSAGYQDFRHTLENNSYHYRFNIDDYRTAVQGEANARHVLRTLVEIYESGKSYDAIVLIRGGGAQTDFLIFDNYELSRAVAKFPIPIITGIGHQKNQTICDMMAHTSLKTPTKVAEFIIARNRVFEERIINAQQRIIIKTQQIFHTQQYKLANFKSHFVRDVLGLLHHFQGDLSRLSGMVAAVPKMLILAKTRSLSQIERDLNQHLKKLFTAQVTKVLLFQTMIRLSDPQNILKKGFALIKINNHIINNTHMLTAGDEITIQREEDETIAIISASKKR
jgi:exodeoxyribonuclease VII large subunit